MSKVLRFSVSIGVALCFLLAAVGARAGVIVVGSPLSSEFKGNVHTAGLFSTMANTALGEPGAHVTSPVTGTIVRWRTKGTYVGAYRLRVLRPIEGGAYIGAGASSFQTPVGASLQSFPTSLPIQAGDLIGLDSETEEASYSVESTAGSTWTLFSPYFPEGASSHPAAINAGEAGFDAEVVPTPSLILIGPSSGPLSGGTTVTIAGRELDGATAVKFGPLAASANFTVVSADEITAVAPPGAAPGTVDVTVTTPGGTSAAIPADQFTYIAPPQPASGQAAASQPPEARSTCTVPSLIGKRLKKARTRLSKAACRLGKVHAPNGVPASDGHVVKQVPKPGRTVAAGTKVNVTLG